MQTFSSFPLRARGLLEIFDAAIKLYKQYFWVLLGWSAIVSGVSVLGSFVGGATAIFLTPLPIGAVVCCAAAAVRGQSVEFNQCWKFTQPRYWMMLAMYFLAAIVAFLVVGAFTVALVAVVAAGAFGFQSAPLAAQIGLGVLAFVVVGAVMTVVWTVCFSWVSLVPIVVCMEEDKKGTAALGRAMDIFKGNWLRITALMAIFGLGMLALMGILFGTASLVVGFGQIGDLLEGRNVESAATWLAVVVMGLAYLVLAMLATPLYYLILTVFYLDVRVRREALDLEWTAHASAPTPAAPEYSAPGFIADGSYLPTNPIAPLTPVATAPEYSASEFPSSTNSQPIQQSENPFATRVLSDEPSVPFDASMELTNETPPLDLTPTATPNSPPAPPFSAPDDAANSSSNQSSNQPPNPW